MKIHIDFTCDAGEWSWTAQLNGHRKESTVPYSSFDAAAKEAQDWVNSPNRWIEQSISNDLPRRKKMFDGVHKLRGMKYVKEKKEAEAKKLQQAT